MKEQFIVSANYKDRESPLKWLIRTSTQEPKVAASYKVVKATSVRFGNSTYQEKSFKGCLAVAYCEGAQGYKKSTIEIPREKLQEIVFEIKTLTSGRKCWRFFNSKTQKIVMRVKELYLDEEGRMWAKLYTWWWPW